MPERDTFTDVQSVALEGGLAMHAFFLDIDGTLLDLADSPSRVRVEPGLVETVTRLHTLTAGAVAMISGRSVADIDQLFAPLQLPLAGQHGMERRDAAAAMHTHPLCTRQFAALRLCVAAAAARWPGVLLEDKGASLAVHYRLAPGFTEEIHAVLRDCLARTGDAFCLQPGKMVAELKPGGRDKGTAIDEFMNEPPFSGRVPVFVGDDATDEHGFAVVNRLDGHSVKVGPGETVARWRFRDADVVRLWLKELTG